jgi:hypothetical protein
MCITDFLITFKISKIEIHEVEEILPVHSNIAEHSFATKHDINWKNPKITYKRYAYCLR